MKKGKRHATAHPRTGARLLQPKPNLERKKIRARLPRQGRCAPAHRRPPAPTKAELRTETMNATAPWARKVRPRAPAHACSNQSPNLERKKIRARLSPARKVRLRAPAHACSNQSPNLERKKIRARLPPARKVRPRAPAPACSNQSRTWNGKRYAPAFPRQGRCAPAHRRTLAPTKAELRTKKDTQAP
ncbi:hypothetical protein TRSA_02350 [Treponema saccharophilum]|nr:hypothetical protein TRSA_02350 [Treponema saccharophilum]